MIDLVNSNKPSFPRRPVRPAGGRESNSQYFTCLGCFLKTSIERIFITFLLLFLVFSFNSTSQEVFWHPKYAVATTYSIPFDTVKNYKGKRQVLKMDVYQPVDSSNALHPTIVMCFGGGFYWGDKNNYSMETICNRMAQMGYVAISIDYRTRWKTNQSEIDKGGKTLYRAVQDLSSALHFLELNVIQENSFRIDTSKLFIGGNSSGALTAINYHFNEPNEKDIFTPFKSELGEWQKSSLNPKAIINLCGALSDTNLINKATPILSLHGDQDNIVPYKSARVDFKVPLVTSFPKVDLQGSYWIQQRSNNISAKSYLHTYKNQRHSPFDKLLEPQLYQPNMDVALNLISNFLHQQVNPTRNFEPYQEMERTHLNECGIEILDNEWSFYPVDKYIKKVAIKIEDKNGKKLKRKVIKKKLKAFVYQPKLEPGKYLLKVGFGTYQTSKWVVVR